jgi:dTDP-4-dehydrorhamnose 3,5-epimerase-like enzyme
MTLPKKTKLKQLGDERGNLVAIESHIDIPFDIKRVYYIYNTPESTSRGFHAHKELHQFLVCVSGACKILMDDGLQKQEIVLNSGSEGLFMDRMIWHEMHDLTSDCVLLVLCNEPYYESDYIRDYNEFLKLIKTIVK